MEAREIYISPEEYLAWEREADFKSEYVNGRIYAMAGASRAHNRITSNAHAFLFAQLRGGRCEPFMADMRLKVRATGLYAYPDVMVACDGARYESDGLDTLLDPTVLIEVLSPSTEAWDRTGKFAHYRYLPSLREYLLIAQDRMHVEVFARRGEQWLFTEFNRPDEIVRLESIGCDLALSDLYERVDLPDNPTPWPNQPPR